MENDRLSMSSLGSARNCSIFIASVFFLLTAGMGAYADNDLPAIVAKKITDQYIGHPGERDESARSIDEHVNAISIALDDDNSIEARKMFAKSHGAALKTLNQKLNDELTGKRVRRYLREGDTGVSLSPEDIRAKDVSVQAFIDEINGLISLEGDEALNAFLNIRKRLHYYEDEYFGTEMSPNWTHTGDPGEPLVTPASKSVPAYLAADQRDWASHSYAFNGDLMLLAAAPNTPTEAASCTYTSADLADDGEDITLTPEIHAKAEVLAYSPIKIYEYVANEIEFQPYFGAMKGAHATLLSESGSATDQSSLLIALLRASNIPARYVRGDIEADIGAATEKDSRIVKWLQVDTLLSAANRLARQGNPTATFSPDNFLRFSHIWVEACVPYAHYQGASFDQAGHRWVPLDPSFEVRTFKDDIVSNVAFDLDAYLGGFQRKMPEEEYESLVNAAVIETDQDVNDVGYRSTKQKFEIDILPASLPYNVYQFTDWSNSGTPETATLPDGHRYFFHIDTKNNADVSLGASISVPMREVVLDRVSLLYKGNTAAHETAMQNWRLNGGTAPTTLDLVPVIRIDGVDRATGTSSVKSNTTNNKMDMRVTMGEYRYSLDEKNNCPAVSGTQLINDACFDTIRAANYHSVQAWAYQGTRKILSSMAKELVGHVNTTSQFGADIENTLGQFLHYISLGYMTDISEASIRVGQLTGNTGDNGVHLGITGSQSYVEKVLDIPFGILKTGFYVDVPGGQLKSQDLQDATLDFDAFLVAGYAASAYESQIWQESARLDAISTIRGVQLSKQQGFDVLTINSANQAVELPKLIAVDNGHLGSAAYPSGFIDSVLKAQYLNPGFEIKIPDRRINYEGWEGYTLVATINDGGVASAGFPISGDYAGGYTVSNPTSYNHDPFSLYDTGYFGGTTTSILNGGSATGGSTSSFDLYPAIYQSDYGVIGNGGGITNTFAGDPVNLVTGNFYHTERDLVIPFRDLPFVFERVYNSREPMDGPLGFGWTHSFNHALHFVDEFPDNVVTAGDTNGFTSSIIWTDGTGGEKRIEVVGAASGGVNGSSSFNVREGQYFTFEREVDGSFTVTEKNGLRYRFAVNAGDVGDVAKLTQIESRNGNTLTLSYSGDELDKVTDSVGRFIDFTYAANRISRIEDWTGRAHEYEYDVNGNLVTYKNPLAIAGNQNPVTYDYFTATDSPTIDHAIKSLTLPKGNGMNFEYYVDGRVSSHTNTADETFQFLYNDFRRETVVTDARGFAKQYFFNEFGNPVEIIDEEGGISTYEYTDANDSYLRTAVVNEARLRTEYEYNTNGTLVLQRNPSGSTVTYSDFTAFEQPGKIKDANGNYTLLQYDGDGNVSNQYRLKAGVGAATVSASYVPQQSDLLSWTKHTYDNAGNLTGSTQVGDVVTAEGFTQQRVFDNNQLYATELQRCGDKTGDGIIDLLVDDLCDVATLNYDTLGRLQSGVNERFEPVEYRYDLLDRVVRGTDDLGGIRDYGYDDNGNADYQALNVFKVLNSYQNGEYQFSYKNRSIDPLPVGTDPENLLVLDNTSQGYDDSDRMTVSIDAGGNASYFSYDPMGNLERLTNPDNYSIRFKYDRLGRVVSALDEEGREARRDIDPVGRMRSLTDPNGNTEAFSYFDAANDGRMEQRCDAENRCTSFGYDSNGNVTVITDNAGNSTLVTYDALNRSIRIAEPVYNDPVHGQVRPVTRYTYDLLGNIVQTEAGYTDVLGMAINDSLQLQQSSVFDDWGRALSVTDALGETSSYSYNVSGDLVSEENPFIQATNPIGSDTITTRQINRTYAYGGLITKDSNVNYEYDILGRLLSIKGTRSGYANDASFVYDDAHRLVSQSSDGITRSYQYSAGGLLEKETVERGAVIDRLSYRYDKTGRVQSIGVNDTWHVNYAFDDGGRLKQKTYPGGVKESYDYYSDDSLKQLLVEGPSANPLLQQGFTYDNLGRRDSLTENLNGASTTSSYGYDALSRLTSETLVPQGQSSQTQSFAYDAFNNRTTHTQFDGTKDYYQYDAAHQLKAIRDTDSSGVVKAVYQYTPMGELFRSCEGASANIVSSDAFIRGECDLREYAAFEYDANSHGRLLRQVRYDDSGTNYINHNAFFAPVSLHPDVESNTISYTYDAMGRRMEVSGFQNKGVTPFGSGFSWNASNLNSFNTQYRYQGEDVYLRYEQGGSEELPDAAFLHGPGVDAPLIRFGGDGSLTNYHLDGRNSAVLTTNASDGSVVAAQQFDAFGNVSQTSGSIQQYGYTGREQDANGLMHYRARYYNPKQGRFTSRDPKGFVDGINRYAYVRNNPVNRIDPDGTVSIGTNNFTSFNNNYFGSSGSSSSSSQSLLNTISDTASAAFDIGAQALTNLLTNTTVGVGFTIDLPSRLPAFLGGDQNRPGFVGFGFDFVVTSPFHKDGIDAGVTFSRRAGGSYGAARASANFSAQVGDIADRAGSGGEVGVFAAVAGAAYTFDLNNTLTGSEFSLGLGIEVSGAITSTSALSFRQGVVSSGCDKFVCGK